MLVPIAPPLPTLIRIKLQSVLLAQTVPPLLEELLSATWSVSNSIEWQIDHTAVGVIYT